MSKPIVWWPHAVLTTPARPVSDFGPALEPLLADMRTALEEEKGVGIAANQIGVGLRLAIVAPEDVPPFVIANPQWLERSGEVTYDEGCLSVPYEWEKVKRYEKVRLKFQDETGAEKEFSAEGRVAHIVQHEVDHLDGRVYVDLLSPLKKSLIRQRMMKRQKEREREAKRPKPAADDT